MQENFAESLRIFLKEQGAWLDRQMRFAHHTRIWSGCPNHYAADECGTSDHRADHTVILRQLRNLCQRVSDECSFWQDVGDWNAPSGFFRCFCLLSLNQAMDDRTPSRPAWLWDLHCDLSLDADLSKKSSIMNCGMAGMKPNVPFKRFRFNFYV